MCRNHLDLLLLYELSVRLSFPVFLHCDNLSATYLAFNSVHHAYTRHIELDYHLVRENVALGNHLVCYISTDQPTDLLTKTLHQLRNGVLRSKFVRSG